MIRIQAQPLFILIPIPGGLQGLKLLPCNDGPLSDGQPLTGGKSKTQEEFAPWEQWLSNAFAVMSFSISSVSRQSVSQPVSQSVSQSVRGSGACVSRMQCRIIKVRLLCNGGHPEAVPVFPWSSASHSHFSRRLEKAFASQLVGVCQEGP